MAVLPFVVAPRWRREPVRGTAVLGLDNMRRPEPMLDDALARRPAIGERGFGGPPPTTSSALDAAVPIPALVCALCACYIGKYRESDERVYASLLYSQHLWLAASL